MPPPTDTHSLTLMYWSASQLYRRGRTSQHVKPTLWHVVRHSHGALRKRAIKTLKEVING
jgi:hypothetical protein